MKRALAAALAAIALAAHADGAQWYLQHDNDVATATDRWYTSGVKLARVSSHGGYDLEWAIAQEIYTPEPKHFAPGRLDRAPTALLYLSLARHDPAPTCLQTIDLSLGVRGPSALGEETTELVHRLIEAREVDWTFQEPDQPFAQLAFTRSHRMGAATVHYGGVLGTDRRFLHTAAEWRFGAEVASSVLRFAPTPPPRKGLSAWGGFAGAGLRFVDRDDLMGRSYDIGLAAPVPERFVGRAAAGVGYVSSWGSAVFTVVFDSREFEAQRRPHRFGSLVVHLDF